MALRPPPERLYGRQQGRALRPRQKLLLAETLPRLRLGEGEAARLDQAFREPVERIWLEVGFGGGEHALASLDADPGLGLVAAEVFEAGLCSMLSRLVPEGGEADAPLTGRLRIWDDDARALLRLLPDASLDGIFLLFPDPWPKARHAKRRFVHPDILARVARVLKPGGEWRIATDDPTYQVWVEEVFSAQSAFRFDAASASRPPGWPPTRYEAKALLAGRVPHYWRFRLG